MTPDLPRLYATLDTTWPAASTVAAGPWLLREGGGGGKRVSCITAEDGWSPDDLQAAEQAQRMMRQEPLFMIRAGETALDVALESRGYEIIDPVNLWVCKIGLLTETPPHRMSAFALWEPLAVMREIWVAGGIGPARVGVMERARVPKTALFGRVSDKPAGAGYCAIHDGIAMVHALEVLEAHRGKGVGTAMMRRAAVWAESRGARYMSLACLTDNAAANGLYASLGMELVGQYHYRIKPGT
ncbi:GNAT family N-acetyltransferase [Yangia mangrovi]|uniref:GNAT family N-acetyltransferase n=1 Tax=Alloyangia mangrovi TaxID=1779329 RepID=A0A2A3JXP7_9RHOB|nr:GNAT family N-acetyltransferase [Alloyangia mangrovi]MCT4371656.1 GNAT family N-acetyltransferase [Alloyangia mangrovi]